MSTCVHTKPAQKSQRSLGRANSTNAPYDHSKHRKHFGLPLHDAGRVAMCNGAKGELMFDEKEQHRMWVTLQDELRHKIRNQFWGQLSSHLQTRLYEKMGEPLWQDMKPIAGQIGVQMRVRGR